MSGWRNDSVGDHRVPLATAPASVYCIDRAHSLTTPRLNPSSGTPLYLQLVEHLKHAIHTGAITAGEQLPSVRKMAEDLVINPNTVVRAYRDLESEGIVELRHGSGVFVRDSVPARTDLMKRAGP